MYKTHSPLAHTALLFMALIYAALFTVGKLAMQSIPPHALSLFRVGIAFLLFALFQVWYGREKVDRQDLPRLILAGTLGIGFNLLSFFQGLTLTSAINSSLIMSTTPVWVIIGAALFLGESLSSRKICGIMLCTIGLFALITKGDWQIDFTQNTGNFWILLSSLSYALLVLLIKPMMKKYRPNTVLTWVFGVGFLFLLPFGGKDLAALPFVQLSPELWWYSLFIGVFATFGVHSLNAYALRSLPAGIVSYYLYLYPVLAAILACSLGLERLSTWQVGAASIVLLGVFVGNHYRSPLPTA